MTLSARLLATKRLPQKTEILAIATRLNIDTIAIPVIPSPLPFYLTNCIIFLI